MDQECGAPHDQEDIEEKGAAPNVNTGHTLQQMLDYAERLQSEKRRLEERINLTTESTNSLGSMLQQRKDLIKLLERQIEAKKNDTKHLEAKIEEKKNETKYLEAKIEANRNLSSHVNARIQAKRNELDDRSNQQQNKPILSTTTDKDSIPSFSESTLSADVQNMVPALAQAFTRLSRALCHWQENPSAPHLQKRFEDENRAYEKVVTQLRELPEQKGAMSIDDQFDGMPVNTKLQATETTVNGVAPEFAALASNEVLDSHAATATADSPPAPAEKVPASQVSKSSFKAYLQGGSTVNHRRGIPMDQWIESKTYDFSNFVSEIPEGLEQVKPTPLPKAACAKDDPCSIKPTVQSSQQDNAQSPVADDEASARKLNRQGAGKGDEIRGARREREVAGGIESTKDWRLRGFTWGEDASLQLSDSLHILLTALLHYIVMAAPTPLS